MLIRLLNSLDRCLNVFLFIKELLNRLRVLLDRHNMVLLIPSVRFMLRDLLGLTKRILKVGLG